MSQKTGHGQEMAPTVDQETREMMALVRERKTEIRNLERPRYATTMTFSPSEGKNAPADSVNLHTVTSREALMKIAGQLCQIREGFSRAGELMGGVVPSLTWQGYPIEAWLGDLKTRLEVVQLAEKRQRLEVLEKRLDAIVSPELRRQMEIEEIRKEITQEA